MAAQGLEISGQATGTEVPKKSAGGGPKKANRGGGPKKANRTHGVFSLTETDSWCYHEGSYGHNPEYGSTHTLTLAEQGAEHTTTDYDDNGGNVRKSAASAESLFFSRCASSITM